MSPLKALFNVLFPTTCVCCDRTLVVGEHIVCLRCMADVAPVGYSAMHDNPVERRLMGCINLVSASAMCDFVKDGVVQKIVHSMKYHGNADLCRMMGRQMGMDLLHSGRFDDVDVLIPIPLHWYRRMQRGYNQSKLLCDGIVEVFPRPINTTAVVRHRYTRRQSLQNRTGREGNVEGAFRLRRPNELKGCHMLLVDDVLTTGATVRACASVLENVEGLKVSVAVFSLA